MARMTSGRGKPASKHKIVLTTIWVVAVVVILCGVSVFGSSGYAIEPVPGPDKTEADDTVTILRRAAEAQDVCYGWRLQDRAGVVSVGSNLGDGMAVDEDPLSCPRWVEVVAKVIYTPESSEALDTATVWVESSPNLPVPDVVEFDRFGLDSQAFIDEPGWSITRAAVILPLLLVEAGTVPAVPVPTDAAEAAPPALPAGGSDFLRDRWGYLLAAVLLLLVTGLMVAIGWVLRRTERARMSMARPVVARIRRP